MVEINNFDFGGRRQGSYQLAERSTRSIIHTQFISSMDAWSHPPIPKARGHTPETSHANLTEDAQPMKVLNTLTQWPKKH